MLLVHNHKAQIFHRRKHTDSGADHDLRFASPYAHPLIKSLSPGQLAVQNCNAIFTKTADKTIRYLFCQCNFRYQHDGRFPHFQGSVNRLHIDFRLSAPRHAVEEKIFLSAAFYGSADSVYSLLLLDGQPVDILRFSFSVSVRFLFFAFFCRLSVWNKASDRIEILDAVASPHPYTGIDHLFSQRKGRLYRLNLLDYGRITLYLDIRLKYIGCFSPISSVKGNLHQVPFLYILFGAVSIVCIRMSAVIIDNDVNIFHPLYSKKILFFLHSAIISSDHTEA